MITIHITEMRTNVRVTERSQGMPFGRNGFRPNTEDADHPDRPHHPDLLSLTTPLFMRCSAWPELAEHAAESLRRGMRVIVSGRMK